MTHKLGENTCDQFLHRVYITKNAKIQTRVNEAYSDPSCVVETRGQGLPQAAYQFLLMTWRKFASGNFLDLGLYSVHTVMREGERKFTDAFVQGFYPS